MSDDQNNDEASKAAARADDEAPRWAADEPTAMWNADSVLEHGYDGVAEKLRGEDDKSSPAATDAAVRGQDGAKVLTGAELAADAAAVAAAAAAAAERRQKKSSVSWVLTVAVALGIGVAVFFLVRMLR